MKILTKNQGHLILNKNYIKWDLSHTTRSVVITFADAYRDPISCPSLEQASKGQSIWGFDYIKKLELNVISISSLSEPSWYRENDLFHSLATIEKDLSELKIFNRIGYAVSMGAFGASALSDILKIKKNILFYPISTLDTKIAPFITGYKWARDKFNWNTPHNDGANCKAEGIIIYDPLNKQDKLHQERYGGNYYRIRALCIGHGGASKIINTGLVKTYLSRAYSNSEVSINELREIAKKRRYKQHYHDDMLAYKKQSFKRKFIIKYQKIKLIHNDIEIARLLLNKEIDMAIKHSENLGGIDSHADVFRDYALENEREIEVALKCMSWANKIRPNGKFIKYKLDIYNLNIKKSHTKDCEI
ncbi:hypothetical protein [Oceanisphaera sp. IT1-181]|uniref:hypothetical protein n=1 Tax=Oceanisphaera sp. IT1-181 TaxID=3081199 RepID=UPI0029CA5CA2|nr:hypothetical protein [Oceanisphaera sp. IT1-181]